MLTLILARVSVLDPNYALGYIEVLGEADFLLGILKPRNSFTNCEISSVLNKRTMDILNNLHL